MPEVRIVEKTGWEILSGFLKGKNPQETKASSPPVAESLKKAVAPILVPYNPLSLFSGDLVILDLEEAGELRFVVDKLSAMRRTIGKTVIDSIDYVLMDPTDETISVGIRAYDDGRGNVKLILLFPDGDNPYDEELERMLDAMKPGNTEGFPRPEDKYKGFARPLGATTSYVVRVTEYLSDGSRNSFEKTCWDFVRDEAQGDPIYLFEMSREDGYFYTYSGKPLERDLVRAFRY